MEAFAAIVEPEARAEVRIEDVPVVRDFVDIFPDDLPGLPPSRAIEFIIERIPYTHPRASRPYGMSPSSTRRLGGSWMTYWRRVSFTLACHLGELRYYL
ncbi:hypothetical protein Scep_011792 [Stephania cephalantha]|uniref:Reverse transcriptase domain-containing protein n=1 Tax=Stephania cephalantha TaxID=152367 RepID=A0AAP0P6V8_9MAGN